MCRILPAFGGAVLLYQQMDSANGLAVCLCCCQQVQVYLAHINGTNSRFGALLTSPALLNHVLCLAFVGEVVIKGSHQMLQAGGKKCSWTTKIMFDLGVGKKKGL